MSRGHLSLSLYVGAHRAILTATAHHKIVKADFLFSSRSPRNLPQPRAGAETLKASPVYLGTNSLSEWVRIVADEVATKGMCGICIDAIAARAGVCRRLAQGAIRLAEGDGLLTVEERRHQGRKNSPNLVRIISREWQAWMRRGGSRKQHRSVFTSGPGGQPKATGCKTVHPTDKGLLNPGTKTSAEPLKMLPEGQNALPPRAHEDQRSGQRR